MLKFKQFIKPNMSKIVVTVTLILLFIILFAYTAGPALCVVGECKEPNSIQKVLEPFFNFVIYVYNFFEDAGIFLFYEKIYVSENNNTLNPRLPNFISLVGTMVFNLFGFLFWIIIGYLLSCIILFVYHSIKNKHTS
ncbi:MAG: hypothetical protein AABX33_05530 [Nanoarchaeota archaeon]